MFESDSVFWTYACFAAIVAAILALTSQTRKANKLTQDQLILNINQSFIQSKALQDLYVKLEHCRLTKQQQLNDADKPMISAYLSFFTVIYSLKLQRTLSFKTIDRFFAKPFFIAVNNPFVQEFIMADIDHHHELIQLYEAWLTYRRKYKLGEPFNEHPLALLLGRKNLRQQKNVTKLQRNQAPNM